MCWLTEDYGRRIAVDPLSGPDGVVHWAYAEETPSTRRDDRELLAQVETHRRSG